MTEKYNFPFENYSGTVGKNAVVIDQTFLKQQKYLTLYYWKKNVCLLKFFDSITCISYFVKINKVLSLAESGKI